MVPVVRMMLELFGRIPCMKALYRRIVWPRKVAKGDVMVVRYADDLAMGFQRRADAVRFLEEFKEWLAKFSLELHSDKTRLIEFGRYAARPN